VIAWTLVSCPFVAVNDLFSPLWSRIYYFFFSNSRALPSPHFSLQSPGTIFFNVQATPLEPDFSFFQTLTVFSPPFHFPAVGIDPVRSDPQPLGLLMVIFPSLFSTFVPSQPIPPPLELIPYSFPWMLALPLFLVPYPRSSIHSSFL